MRVGYIFDLRFLEWTIRPISMVFVTIAFKLAIADVKLESSEAYFLRLGKNLS